jgi:hypothetical protein
MSHGSNEGENYWPGYVDALTSMVQVLAFVMMMLALAVFALSQSASKHAIEVIAKAVNANVTPNADVKQMTQAIMDQIRGVKRPEPTAQGTKPSDVPAEIPANEPAPPVATRDSGAEKIAGMRLGGARSRDLQTADQAPADAPRMAIQFDERSYRIAQERAQSLTAFADENKLVAGGHTIIINAYAYSGDGALSEARRLAYYRAMTTRKQLVDEKVRPDSIRINVRDTTDKEKGATIELTVVGNRAN